MKTSNLSRITLLCGLALGIMVLWAAVAPSATNVDSARGGWVWVGEGACCWGNVDDNCLNYPWPAICTNDKKVNICNGSGVGGGCVFEWTTPCIGNYYCDNAIDTHCSAG